MNINERLEYIDVLKRELDGLRPLSGELTTGLKQLFDVDFTYNSTAIEGNTFSFQETKILLLEGITVGGKSMREHLEIVNHKEAIDYDEMDMFFGWLFSSKKEHPVIIAAEAHTRFVSIHPFLDGNGRTTRLIMNLILIQNGYTPVVIQHKERVNYLDAIESWQQNNNKEIFYEMILQYEKESLEKYLGTIEERIIWK
jgi:Fic family protein